MEDNLISDAIRGLIQRSGLYQKTRISELANANKTRDDKGTARLKISCVYSGLGYVSIDIPAIQFYCETCKFETTFREYRSSEHNGNDNEQSIDVLTTHICSLCSAASVSHLITYDGFDTFRLAGRSQRLVRARDGFPEEITGIVNDAVSAEAEKDTPAAYYHLRTAIEHHMKITLGKDLEEQIEGQALCQEYKTTIPAAARDTVPSLGPIYSTLSAGMHSRVVSSGEFEECLDQLRDHFEIVRLITKQEERSTTKIKENHPR